MKILEKTKNLFEKIIDFFEYGVNGVPETNLKLKYYNKEKFNNLYYYVIKINKDYRIVKFYNNYSKEKYIHIYNRKRKGYSWRDASYDSLQKEEWKSLIKLLKKENLYKDFDEYIIKENNKKEEWKEKIIW